jgi:hypothetical protein
MNPQRSSLHSSLSSSSLSLAGGAPVLGECYRRASPTMSGMRKSASAGSLGFSFRSKAYKLPKVPRPTRTLVMFSTVKRGLRECIEATEEDIIKLRVSEDVSAASSTGQGKVMEIEKQVKAAERYQKRLEYQIAQIEELEEHYALQQQLREGVKNMAKAYVALPGHHQKESLLNVKCGYKECTQTMCAIEAQLENMLGTFHCQMRGMAGFARLAAGDVFEVGIRYGGQKWKTRGRIGVNQQTWDTDYYVFKALVADVFAIKAVEIRTLGRGVLLGQKNCETKDLMSSHPQMMTVNINTNGSLKLSLIITWNPLEGVDEAMNLFEAPVTPKSQPSQRRSMISPTLDDKQSLIMNGEEGLRRVEMRHRSRSPEQAARHQRMSVPNPSPTTVDIHRDIHRGPSPRSLGAQRPVSVAIMGSISESITDSIHKPRLFDMRLLADSLESPSSRQSDIGAIEDMLHNLASTLEDYRGQYPELLKLEEQIHLLDLLIKRSLGAGSSRSSNVSISIENALGAFDFLETEDYEAGYGSGGGSRRTSFEAQCTLSPESTTKTADSGIESLGNRLREDQALESSLTSSPEPGSTGNEQVDLALIWHLAYCDRLLENLGNFGPLKCREIYSLDKLRRQADIIEQLSRLAKTGPQITDVHAVMLELTEKREVRHFWTRCVEHNILVTNAERFLAQLERSYGDQIRERYDISASKVFRVFVARVLDVPSFDPESLKPCPNVTMHQLFNFFLEEEIQDMEDYINILAGELWISSRLRSGDTDIVIKTVLTFHGTLPPTECLQVVALLLITENAEVREAASSYLHALRADTNLRDKAMVIYVEALEDRNADVRCAACMALKLLKAVESLDQLVYLCQSDSSHMVKVKAKDTLLSFGDEGRKAYENSELTSHGFQGLKVKL